MDRELIRSLFQMTKLKKVFSTIFVHFLFLVTLRFSAVGGFPIVAVPGGCSIGGQGILYHHQNFTTSTFTSQFIHLLALELSVHI